MKTPTCKHCGSQTHLSMKCFTAPRKSVRTITAKKTIKVPSGKKKSVTKAKKAVSRKLVVKKLDSIFSQYIRLRDRGKGCITCGKKQEWREQQDCHFFSRGRYATRWDENNNFAGCVACNVYLKGNYIQYTLKMVDMFGREFVDQLEKKSLKSVKIPTSTLIDMIEDYTNRVNQML